MNIQLPVQNMQRAKGEIDIVLGEAGLKRLYQSGCLKALRPKRLKNDAVLVNTSGGMTSGDRLDVAISLEPRAKLTWCTQAAERVYQCPQGHAQVENKLRVENGARINWLPLETLIYDTAKLSRNLAISLSKSSHYLSPFDCTNFSVVISGIVGRMLKARHQFGMFQIGIQGGRNCGSNQWRHQ